MLKNNKGPLVSVLMPVYNGGLFLSAAIDSILSQTYRNFELVIIDDASGDNTWEIIQSYQKKLPQVIRSYRLTKNIGAFAAVNSIISEVRSKYFALMDSDDISDPERLAKQVSYLEEHPEVIVLGTQTRIIDENGNIIGNKYLPINHRQIYRDFALIHPMVHPSCLIRASLLPDNNKLYEDRFGVNSDYFTFFKLLNYGKFSNLEEPLFNYRIHLRNSSLADLRAKFFNTIKIRITAIKEFGYKLPLYTIPLIGIQTILAVMIPNRMAMSFYLIARGIYSPKRLLSLWKQTLGSFLLRPVRPLRGFTYQQA